MWTHLLFLSLCQYMAIYLDTMQCLTEINPIAAWNDRDLVAAYFFRPHPDLGHRRRQLERSATTVLRIITR
ncbi:hypothetical protein BD289DRAFT_422099 [Coniella lustricola]|uniref:Uncharacterized protein n=1 Tax=Coniella lustricola TaxID=2025994 RepID=A0A2T3ALF1_9PEZI|nr:hypothetical protein BD289DRAFT_422099 [Coniella lustricola]